MSVKIKSLRKHPLIDRECPICGRKKAMEKFQRFCSPICKAQASDIDKYGTEFKVALALGKR